MPLGPEVLVNSTQGRIKMYFFVYFYGRLFKKDYLKKKVK